MIVMKAVVLGGTFNPVHIGHLHLAEEVLLDFDYERIIFIPSNIPAHKEIEDRVTPEDRIHMLELAISYHPAFSLDTCEIERGGISYSIETVRYLKSKYGIDAKPGFIIGDDLIVGFPTWKNADLLSKEARLIVAHRGYTERLAFPYPHTYMDNQILPISSSDVRRRIRERTAVRFLLPAEIWQYIEVKGLYR